jgi:hypothetical protein
MPVIAHKSLKSRTWSLHHPCEVIENKKCIWGLPFSHPVLLNCDDVFDHSVWHLIISVLLGNIRVFGLHRIRTNKPSIIQLVRKWIDQRANIVTFPTSWRSAEQAQFIECIQFGIHFRYINSRLTFFALRTYIDTQNLITANNSNGSTIPEGDSGERR